MFYSYIKPKNKNTKKTKKNKKTKQKQILEMEMKLLSTFFLLSLVFACVTEARPSPGEYWKSRMNGEAMPKALMDVVSDSDAKTSRFVKDFNTKPNVIIYHSNYHANKHAQAPKPC